MGKGDQTIHGEVDVFPPDDPGEGRFSLVERPSVGTVALCRLQVAEIDRLASAATGKQHASLLEGLANRRHAESQGRFPGKVRLLQKPACIACGQAVDKGIKSRIAVRFVQPAAGEHVGAAHEGLVAVPAHHENLVLPPAAVAHDNDRGRVAQRIRFPGTFLLAVDNHDEMIPFLLWILRTRLMPGIHSTSQREIEGDRCLTFGRTSLILNGILTDLGNTRS